MLFGRVAVADIERVRFNDRRIRNVLLESFDHVARENVRAVALARVKLDGDLADDFPVYERIELLEMLGVDLAREVDDGLLARKVVADAAGPDHRRLGKFALCLRLRRSSSSSFLHHAGSSRT